MQTLNLHLKLWPVYMLLVSLIGSFALLFYRTGLIEVAVNKLKGCLFNKDGSLIYTPKSEFDKKCTAIECRVKKLDERLKMDEEKYVKEKECIKAQDALALRLGAVIAEKLSESEDKLIERLDKSLDQTQKLILAEIKTNNGGGA